MPSSPYGPCSTGNTTSSRAAGAGRQAARRRRPARARDPARTGHRGGRAPPRAGRQRDPGRPVPAPGAGRHPTSQWPSLVIPIGTTSYRVVSIAGEVDAADASDTSCSPERPPKTTPTRKRPGAPPARGGSTAGAFPPCARRAFGALGRFRPPRGSRDAASRAVTGSPLPCGVELGAPALEARHRALARTRAARGDSRCARAGPPGGAPAPPRRPERHARTGSRAPCPSWFHEPGGRVAEVERDGLRGPCCGRRRAPGRRPCRPRSTSARRRGRQPPPRGPARPRASRGSRTRPWPASAIWSACGSASPMSSDAMRTSRRARKSRSSPASIIRASQ